MKGIQWRERLFLFFTLLAAVAVSTIVKAEQSSSLDTDNGDGAAALLRDCRSTDRHIAWRKKTNNKTTEKNHILRQENQRRAQEGPKNVLYSSQSCLLQSHDQARRDAYQFLRQHVMAFDQAKLETMGFHATHSDHADGLDQGLIGPTITLALKTKTMFPWTDALPQDIFYEYVLNYANLNEARSNWRPYFWKVLTPQLLPYLEQQQQNISSSGASQQLPILRGIQDIVYILNAQMWHQFRPDGQSIVFHSGQTPLIFDPMSIIVHGYCSCTGLAVFFVNALRTVGVAARVVGTPAWNGQPEHGNHNWLEIWDIGEWGRVDGKDKGDEPQWRFMEPSPNLTKIDNIDKDPCSRWFCHPKFFPPLGDNSVNATTVSAARLVFTNKQGEGHNGKSYYPMPWEGTCMDVPGEDRSDYYQSICSKCSP